MELRRAKVTHLQRLSIGYHSRVSSSVVQTTLVRDVENVELMLQQLTHPLLSSATVFLGAVTMTAIMVPQFLPVYALLPVRGAVPECRDTGLPGLWSAGHAGARAGR